MFFIDDLILRSIGLALPPFDIFWLLEMLGDYARGVLEEGTQRELRNSLKENRLLFELGEMSLEEYEQKNKELNQKIKKAKKVNRINLKQRINILG